MFEESRSGNSDGEQKKLEIWIDNAIGEDCQASEVSSYIARFCMPGNGEYFLTPESLGNEGWYWAWNRAGFLYIQKKRPFEAATVFKSAYLASLKVQAAGQYRIHKGMPLCNISYSYLAARSHERAMIPALVGMVDDVLTFAKWERPNFQNLLSSGFPEALARQLAGSFHFQRQTSGITPLFPEIVLDCAQRDSLVISRDYVQALQYVVATFSPTAIEQALILLEEAWEAFRPTISRALNWRPENHASTRGTFSSSTVTAAPTPPGVFTGSLGSHASGHRS